MSEVVADGSVVAGVADRKSRVVVDVILVLAAVNEDPPPRRASVDNRVVAVRTFDTDAGRKANARVRLLVVVVHRL